MENNRDCPHLKAVLRAQETYLTAKGWVKAKDSTANGYTIWVDGVTLNFCTFPAAVNNQLRRDGFFKKSSGFSTGLMVPRTATPSLYATLKREMEVPS